MVDVSRNTINKLLLDLGAACSIDAEESYYLPCKLIQCDEIWSFIAAKQKNVTPKLAAANPHAGDVWTWVAMDADTKLICTWMVGNRDAYTARVFMEDLKCRLANRVQLATDGLKHYYHAVAEYFDDEVDYATLIKIYGGTVDENKPADKRYSPAQCLGCERNR